MPSHRRTLDFFVFLVALLSGNALVAQIEFRPVRTEWADGLELAVVQRAHAKQLAFSIEKVENGVVRIPKLADAKSVGEITVFLVVGVRSLEDFDKFLERPGSRQWTGFRLENATSSRRRFGRSRPASRRRRVVVPAQSEVLAHGTVLGVGEAPIAKLALSARLRRGEVAVRSRLFAMYDPCSGRFWVQAVSPPDPGALEDWDTLLLDVDPDPRPHPSGRGPAPLYAALRAVSFERGERRTLRLPKPGAVEFEFPQLRRPGVASGFSVALRNAKSGARIPLRVFLRGRARFRGLERGVYELDLEYDGRVLETWKDLRVEPGETLAPEPIVLKDVLREVRIDVRGDFRSVQIERGDLAGGRSGSGGTYRPGAPLLVPRIGCPVVIRGPSDEYGPRLIPKLDRDMSFELEIAKTARVALEITDEVRKEPALFRDLYVLMEPANDPYPDWAWGYFARKARFRGFRGRDTGSATATAHAAVSEASRRVDIRVPFSGTWRFHWAYMRRGVLQKVATPFPHEAVIEKDEQRVSLGLPVSRLRAAQKLFVTATRR